MMHALGMKPGDIRKRAANLAELRARILAQPETTSPRKTLSEPEPYVFEVGGIYAYPTQQGHPINPYLAPKSFNRAAWSPDGFGLFLALGRGRAFDYLTWYHGATTFESFSSLPDEAQLTNEIRWRTPPVYGNCSLKHFQKLEMQEVGIFPIDPASAFFPIPCFRRGLCDSRYWYLRKIGDRAARTSKLGTAARRKAGANRLSKPADAR
jgi:hypothetical protein